MAKKVWLEVAFDGWAGYKLFNKLGSLKKHLKEWNTSMFGNLTSQLKLAEVEFHHLDLVAESKELTAQERCRKAELREAMWKLNKRT